MCSVQNCTYGGLGSHSLYYFFPAETSETAEFVHSTRCTPEEFI